MREYQAWTRAQIASRVAEIHARVEFLEAREAEIERMHIDIEDLRGKVDIDNPDMRSTIVSIRRTTLLTAVTEETTACWKEVQALNVEIHIRDSPKLTAELGAGID